MTPVTTHKWLMVFVAFYLAFAIWAFIAPTSFAENLGYQLSNNSAYNEFRANYGGMFLGTALFLAMASRTPSMFRGAWLFLTLSLGGLAVGRLISMLVDGMPRSSLIFFMCLEAGSSLLAFYFYRKEGGRERSLPSC